MRYAHIHSRITNTPWFIDESTLTAITQLLQSRINGSVATIPLRIRADDNPDLDGIDDDEDEPTTPVPNAVQGVALIPISGVLGKHLSRMETMCGGCDMDAIRSRFDQAMADPAVRAVVLCINSPGGMAIGCHELFTHMYEQKKKPLYAFTDTMCGSAAYYLACAADVIYTAPTAQVGSIGSMLIVRDDSEMLAKMGVKFSIIRSGKWKGLGHPSQPLSKEGTAILQNTVDTLGAQFRADVSRARPSIAAEDMEGLSHLGREAVDRHLADEVVLDLQQLLARLGG